MYSSSVYSCHLFLTYSASVRSILPMLFFHRTRTYNFIIAMETQKTPNSQSNFEEEEWSWRNQPSWCQTILHSYSHQYSVILAQKQKYTPVKEERKLGVNPCTYGLLIYWHRWQEYTMKKKMVSSIIGTGKTGQLHVK